MSWMLRTILVALMLPGPAYAQTAPRGQTMERALRAGLPARWWQQPALAQRLGLSADQQKRMDDIFQQSRLKLIDLNASLEKEEAVLEPLIAEDRPDEAKVHAQIDRIAQARAELEKANAYLLFSIRLLLSPEQWRKLQSNGPLPRRLREESETGPTPRRQ